MRDASRPLASA